MAKSNTRLELTWIGKEDYDVRAIPCSERDVVLEVLVA